MGNLTDKINSMLKELQEVTDSINGVERRPTQPLYQAGAQPTVVYGRVPGQTQQAAVYPPIGQAAVTADRNVAPRQPVVEISKAERERIASTQTDDPYKHAVHGASEQHASPINLSAYDAHPLMQGIILSEVLGKPVSRRPRGLGRRV